MTESTGNRELTREILQAEGRRRGFDDWQRWVISACPLGEWPGRDMVDLDNVGDPGAWLESHQRERFVQGLNCLRYHTDGIRRQRVLFT